MEIPEPHAVFLPFPVQGHIKPLLMLAELVFQAGFQVTFINSVHCQDRLERSTDISAFCERFPKFRFVSIPDGLPPDHPRSGLVIADLFSSTRAVTKPEFHHLLINNLSQENGLWSPPTCIIADGLMSFAMDTAEELGIPAIVFRTCSAYCTWVYFHLSDLIGKGQVPIHGDSESDKMVTCIPGLENVLRCRDLPSICRLESNNPVLQFFASEAEAMRRATALILNTSEEVEGPMIAKLRSIIPTIYCIGPLHALLKNFISCSNSDIQSFSSSLASSQGILWKEDKSCMAWLDSQPSGSVVYVSLGSLVYLSLDQLLEFWHGLVNSGKPFLWVIRSDSVIGKEGFAGLDCLDQVSAELEAATRERSCIVSWAPQAEVLAHPAVGGFLTHSGWNSTVEAMYAGVPMICWPLLADQQVNSRCVSDVWRIGLDMKDTCDRCTVERMVRDLMENKSEEILKSCNEIARMARDSVKEGGSSECYLKKLIQDLESTSLTKMNE